jgi:chorismate mutase
MSDENTLSNLRKEIDRVDNEIIQLLRQRTEYVKKVGEFKASKTPEHISFIRSGREATMLRHLTEQLEDTFPKAAIATIWRMIISTSLNLEKPMSIASYYEAGQEQAYWLAREYYGAFLDITRESSTESVIKRVAKNEVSVGILPLSEKLEQAWWLRPQSEQNDIFVFAKIPFITEKSDPFSPVLAIANVLPEATGDDISLLAVEGVVDTEKTLANIGSALNSSPSILAQEGESVLVEVPDYIAVDDVRAVQIPGVRVRLLGSYAKPIVVKE